MCHISPLHTKAIHGLTLHDVCELDVPLSSPIRMVVEVCPGSNLFDLGDVFTGDTPLLVDGRVEIQGEPTRVRSTPRAVPGESPRDFMERMQRHAEALRSLKTWYLTVYCADEAEVVHAYRQMDMLQAMAPDHFALVQGLSSVEWLPDSQELLAVPEDTLTGIALPPVDPDEAVIRGDASGQTNDQEDLDDDPESRQFSDLGWKACQIILASLRDNPTQSVKTTALSVVAPTKSIEHWPLGELVGKCRFPDGYGFRISTYGYWEVWITYRKGRFFPTLVRGDGHDHPFPAADILEAKILEDHREPMYAWGSILPRA